MNKLLYISYSFPVKFWLPVFTISLLVHTNVNLWLTVLNRVYQCISHLAYILCLSILTYLHLHSCVYLCLPLFTSVYPSLPLFACVYLCLPLFTGVYLYLPLFTGVYPCLPVFTCTYPCLRVFTCVYPCLPVFTLV